MHTNSHKNGVESCRTLNTNRRETYFSGPSFPSSFLPTRGRRVWFASIPFSQLLIYLIIYISGLQPWSLGLF